ncbi:MAG TPA: (Fe-S)-binding protein [Desulfobulbus sp.]|nr:(Fe-S)-binding protein [Desulfobulbus sp.]
MFDPKIIIDLLAENVRRTGNPFGLSTGSINGWWKGADLPRQGANLLFTGMMYQMVPAINAATGLLGKYEDTPAEGRIRFGRRVPRFLSAAVLKMATAKEDRSAAAGVLMDITRILQASGVDFAYRPELDGYSGILLYDLGDRENFIAHARRVAGRLQEAGVERLITVDPHTTWALRELYPRYTGYRPEVRTYFELARLQGNGDREVTLHDPCFYGRYLELSQVPRTLLAGLGVRCADVNSAGPFTSCCGGPAESVSPALALTVGRRRLAELQATGRPLVTMCPICHANLRRAGADVMDLSALLVRFTRSGENSQKRAE